MNKSLRKQSLLTTAAVLAGFVGTTLPLMSAVAQQSNIEEIFVTARKREEKLLETPVAVSAVTAKDIEALGLANLNDVTKATPGFFISNYGTQRNDRASQVITVRGMPVSAISSASKSSRARKAPTSAVRHSQAPSTWSPKRRAMCSKARSVGLRAAIVGQMSARHWKGRLLQIF